ncbi:MAG: N-acyl homoserine lactone hydrolase [Thermoleophilaceae bacterium]|nr:N-acyl homoserine lactone hydrolase [Thermoleophilaceae bacterium]
MSDAQTVRLELLWCADSLAPPGWFYAASGTTAPLRAMGVGVDKSAMLSAPIGAYLVRHPEAGPFLVDTGVHPSVATDLRGNFGRLNAIVFSSLRTTPQRTAAAQIARRGVAAADVELVVMTHLHVDHASGMSEFPRAEFVCSRREWAAAHSRLAPIAGYHRAQLPPGERVRTIDFDGPAVQPHGPFSRTLDLLGDGSVRLVSTPGHTVGHLSVLLQLDGRQVLVVGDALYTLRNMHEDLKPQRVVDDQAYDRSVAELRAFAAERPDALLIPTHDAGVWERLYGHAARDEPRAVA